MVTERLGRELMGVQGGYGYGGVIRDSRGRAISPDWIAATGAAAVGANLAIVGTISHLALEHGSTALDLGARDGRNLVGWPEPGPEGLVHPSAHLFMGNPLESWLEMSEIGGDVASLALSQDGRLIGLAETFGGSTGAAFVVDPTGERVPLGTLDLSGVEQISFSADGRYLLVPRFQNPVLIEVATGSAISLPVTGDLAWWPAYGASTILWLDQRDYGHAVICAYDVATDTIEQVRPVVYPDAPGLEPSRHRLNHPTVNDTGDKVLCGTYFGVDPAVQEERGSRERVSILDLNTGRVAPLVDPFVNGDRRLEREHSAYRWLRSEAPAGNVVIHDALTATRAELVYDLTSEQRGLIADDSRNLAVACLRKMVGTTQEQTMAGGDPRFVPEALRCVQAMADYGPDRLMELAEWIEQASGMLSAVAPDGLPREGWKTFRSGWKTIRGESSTPIAWNTWG